MRDFLKNYLYNSPPFEIFGFQHWESIIITVFAWIVIPIYFKRYCSENSQNKFGGLLGYLVMSNYLIWVTFELIAGTFDIKLHLPFQLCRTANLLLPLVMIKRNQMLYEIIYFWGLSGMLQGMFTPDITNAFPHFHFLRYWIGHNGLILAIIYATAIYGMRPSIVGIRRAFIALNIFFIITIPVNLFLDANYFWICGKPPMPSLLDFMGPWPWYILTGEIVALLHFGLAYLPFYIIDIRRKNLQNLK